MLKLNEIDLFSDSELDAQLARTRRLIKGSANKRIVMTLRAYEKRLLAIATERDLAALADEFTTKGRMETAAICLRQRSKMRKKRRVDD